MAAAPTSTMIVQQDALMNYLLSMARTVEGTVHRALDSLVRLGDSRKAGLPGEIFLLEPRINEMEILIDHQAVRLLRMEGLPEEDIRLIVASLKITNDLERMGDLAVHIAERVVSLGQMPRAEAPSELAPMASTARVMVSKALGALIFRNAVLANEILESDAIVDAFRDRIFEHLLAFMRAETSQIAPSLQFLLATRSLEGIADHATNIAEDIIFWVRGLDARHGKGLPREGAASPWVAENSSSVDDRATRPR